MGFLQGYCSTQIKEGRFIKVPILYGTNTDEGTAITPSPINSYEDFRAAVTPGAPHNDTLPVIEYLYLIAPEISNHFSYALSAAETKTYGTQFKRGSSFFGDAVEHSPRRKVVTEFSRNNVSTYSYRFNIKPARMSSVSGLLIVKKLLGYSTTPMELGTQQILLMAL